ncbi:MAG: hypothetical protein ACR2KS_05170 [Candidatus Eremiobacter antarcticus]|nr:hypothetical protein [Candidatus Eremiobacteraeota bacterium]MBC5807411.1 hypothetical protein [Candidatus Eremiobacteraeota bacterium]
MHRLRAGMLALLCVVAAAGCTTNHNPGDVKFTTNALLRIAVGTFNDPTAQFGTAGVSLNVVASFRNQFGNSAFISPGDTTLALPAGGGTADLGTLFSYGQGPNGLIVGLPPAYPPNGNGVGFGTGFIPTGAPATPGAYAATARVPVNGTTATYGASATLPATPTVLGPEGAPSYVSDGANGGTFTITQPAGVTESLIVVFDNSDPTAPFEVATAETNSNTATIPSGTLPAGPYFAFVIGADYPLLEAGAPISTTQTPTLNGANGSADLTVGGNGNFTQTGTFRQRKR